MKKHPATAEAIVKERGKSKTDRASPTFFRPEFFRPKFFVGFVVAENRIGRLVVGQRCTSGKRDLYFRKSHDKLT